MPGAESIGSDSPLDPLDPLICLVACRRPWPRTARAVEVQVGLMSDKLLDVEKKDVLETSGADWDFCRDRQHSSSAWKSSSMRELKRTNS